jgi:UDP-glucose 4-epimerase
VFNVGGDEPIAHRDLVAILLNEAGRGTARYVPWPDEKRRIDIGSFYSDSTKFSTTTGWQPTIDLRAGFRRTLGYYRDNFDRYVDPSDALAPA